MMRVIHQMESRAEAWDLFVHGAAKKHESFDKYTRRIGVEARTPESTSTKKADAARTVQQVQKRLGGFYKPARIIA